MLKAKLSRTAISLLVGCLVINTSLSPTFAQSTDKKNPTPLTTHVISGKGILNQDQFFYYRFTAKPGKMPITLDIDPRDGDDHGANGANVEAVLEKPNGEIIGNIAGFAGIPTPSRKVRRFEFKKETPVILILNILGGTQSNYTYRLKIDGNWKELTKSESNPRILNRPIY